MILWRGSRKWSRLLILAVVYFYCVILLHSRRKSLEDQQVLDEDSIPITDLEERGDYVQKLCKSHPPPLTTHLRNWKQALSVSYAMSQHFYRLHIKEATKRLVHMTQQNIVWCSVPKVASTSFSRSLLHLEGMTDKEIDAKGEPLQVILRKLLPPIPGDRLNKTIENSISFLFTRHPFARVVSAYRNKLENTEENDDGKYFFNNYGRKIVIKYRMITRQSVGNGLKSENTKGMSSNSGNNNGNNNDNQDNSVKTSDSAPQRSNDYESEYRRDPTFEEFVDYLINTDINDFDEHWRPVWLQCNVCDINYDYVIKYEHFQEEIKSLLNYLKELNKLPMDFNINWENKGITSLAVTKTYMKKINIDKIMKLYEKYREDFDYFHYDMFDFL